MFSTRIRAIAAALAAAGSLAACHGDDVTGAQKVVVTLPAFTIAPSQIALIPADTATLAARFQATDGTLTPATATSWASSDTGVVAVSASGQVTARGVGSATITSKADGRTAYATVKVQAPVVASLIASPTTLNLSVGQASALSVTLLDAKGYVVTGRRTTYASNSAAVATVDDQGMVKGMAAGSSVVTVSSEGKTATIAINVARQPASSIRISPQAIMLPLYESQALTANATDAAGAPVNTSATAYASSDNGVVTVSPAGVVAAVGQGTARVYATLDGRRDSATVNVGPALVYSISLGIDTLRLARLDSSRLNLVLRDKVGNIVTPASVAFSSTAASVASVSSSGAVAANAEGVARIDVNADGRGASVVVMVSQARAYSVVATPSPITLGEGGSASLTVTAYDKAGVAIAGKGIGYYSDNPILVAVDARGTVFGLRATSSPATVYAVADGASVGVPVTVNPQPVASIGISPTAATVSRGSKLRVSAVAYDINGAALPGAALSFSVDNVTLATIDAQGNLTANATATGVVKVTATSSNGVSAVASITIN